MELRKYKYYFKKTKSEIVKDVFRCLLTAGAIYIAASSPYFILNVLKNYKNFKKYPKKKVGDTFYNLKRQGLIEIRKTNHQIYISLTKDGKKRANWMQIDDLKIKKQKKWDRKWRLVIFDIVEFKKNHREAFRGKLKQLGFYPLQKSVWIYPFDCQPEIELLKDFFGLSDKEIRVIVAGDVGPDDKLKEIFKLT